MEHTKVIESVMDEILLDEIHYDALSSKLDQLSTYLVSLSGLDTEGLISRENIKSENGEALSPYYAALCINDICLLYTSDAADE